MPTAQSDNLKLINAVLPPGSPTGNGQAIAVIDGGVDKDHGFLRGKVTREICLNGCAEGLAVPAKTAGASNPCMGGACNPQGTQIAGIAAGASSNGGSGVASGAQIISIKVNDANQTTDDSIIIQALEEVFKLNAEGTARVAAVNLSLGNVTSYQGSNCTRPGLEAAVQNLKSMGIAVVAAGGDGALRQSLASPACLRDVVSVGAVRDAGSQSRFACDSASGTNGPDSIACFSNSSQSLSLLAPGVDVLSSLAAPNSHSAYGRQSGTAIAAAHVSGAWAVIKEKAPSATVSDVLRALQDSGKPVADLRLANSARVTSRIDLAAALARFIPLSYSATGTGHGIVNISAPGRNSASCGNDCHDAYFSGTTVTLDAIPAAGSEFAGWTGDCTSTSGTRCTIILTAESQVTAQYRAVTRAAAPAMAAAAAVSPTQYRLTYGVNGVGTVDLLYENIQVSCATSQCIEMIPAGTVGVNLDPYPPVEGDYVFTGWTGDCVPSPDLPTDSCSLDMTGDKTAFAQFVQATKLTINNTDTTSGSYSLSNTGYTCYNDDCTAKYRVDEPVTITASPDQGYAVSWGGDCQGSSLTCSLIMSGDKTVTLDFVPITDPQTLKLLTNRNETVTATNKTTGETLRQGYCGELCRTVIVAKGTPVLLKALPGQDGGAVFTGWTVSGSPAECQGTGDCTVTMTGAKTVTANFVVPKYDVTYSKAAPAGVSVSAKVVLNGVACETTSCVKNASAGDELVFTITGITDDGFSNSVPFLGWAIQGSPYPAECSETRTCAFTVRGTTTVTAYFGSRPDVNLAYTKDGPGNGKVTINGAECGANCIKSYAANTRVTLRVIPPTDGTIFTGWTVAGSPSECPGTGECTITMDAAKSVTASFTAAPRTHLLTLPVAGTGTLSLEGLRPDQTLSGTCTGITIGQNGIQSCQQVSIAEGQPVTIKANPSNGATVRWTNCTPNTGTPNQCSVSLTSDKTVTASFIPPRLLQVTQSGTGTGTLTFLEGTTPLSTTACGTNCQQVSVADGRSIKITASPSGNSTVAWDGCGTGNNGSVSPDTLSCTITMDAAKSVTASFTAAPRTHLLTLPVAGTGTLSLEGLRPDQTLSGTCTGITIGQNGIQSCQQVSIAEGQPVTIKANPSNGATVRWTNCTPNTGTPNQCSVSLTSDKTVTASFIPPRLLQVTQSGTGTGTLTFLEGTTPLSTTACGTNCQQVSVADGRSIKITASPSGNSTVAWDGCGTGNNGSVSPDTLSCTITMDAAKSVTASFTAAPRTYTLAYTKAGTGNGKVTIDGAECADSCSKTYAANTSVTLVAAQLAGSTFTGWSGFCEGIKVPECTVTMDGDQAVTANFVLNYVLSYGTDAGGTVVAEAGLFTGECSEPQCQVEVPAAASVMLMPRAKDGYRFASWEGQCDTINENGYCMVNMAGNRTITAKFAKLYTLTYGSSEGGFVRPDISAEFGDCSSSCINSYRETDRVTLTANPSEGYDFSRWTGDCADTAGPSCAVSMDRARSATAVFAAKPKSWTVQVMLTGAGSGDVTFGGLTGQTVSDCGENCKQVTVNDGTPLTIDANAKNGSTFSDWTGDCTSIAGARCFITVTRPAAVTANFTPQPQAGSDAKYLTYTKGGDGEGTILFTPGADVASCNDSCVTGIEPGMRMRITAEAAPGSVFVGWSGICRSSKKSCILTMKSDMSVTAIFRATAKHALSYAPAGTGNGTVTISPLPEGTSCATGCSPVFEDGTRVTLTAAPDAGSSFAGWSGACRTKRARCLVTMDEAKQVTATFTSQPAATMSGFMEQ